MEKSIRGMLQVTIHNFSSFQTKIPTINSYLLILLGFTFPLSVSIGTAVIGCIMLLWLGEGKFKEKFTIIQHNKISHAFLAFFIIHLIGLLWSEDLKWGLHIVSKEWRMLLPLIFITIVKKEHIQYYIIAFLSAISISEVLSYLIWFGIIPAFQSSTMLNPTPFMSHISYNPFLAFSIFLLIYFIFFVKNYKNNFSKIISLLFLTTMTINIFITGGRAGQIGFFVILSLAFILYFKKNILKSILLILVVLPAIFFIAYSSSTLFNTRIHEGLNDIQMIDKNPNTSVGLRMTFAINTLQIIKENPIFGAGTGDFPKEYEKVNTKRSPNALPTVNPHNMYLLVLAQTGIVGLMLMLSIFYMQIQSFFKSNDSLSPLRLALPILFLTIMLSDSYLLGHHTALLFVYFSAILYKDFSGEKV
ncbi:O-antigen ligase family protein [Sulfurospirillum oryzae]|uniref:O-antigen ligase family protein n=1 Tax=Sulfurospirillum oryzae TaxID=2976535 RepID=UPI0021E921D6|nr:O-antigen ligase family protein [Sulfurospirillum oryzae]